MLPPAGAGVRACDVSPPGQAAGEVYGQGPRNPKSQVRAAPIGSEARLGRRPQAVPPRPSSTGGRAAAHACPPASGSLGRVLLPPDSGLTPFAAAFVSLLTAAVSGLGPAAGTDPPAVAASPGASAPAATAGTSPLWTAPLEGVLLVLEPFDPPAQDWLAGHRGVDLAAAVGTDVLSAGSGVVVWAAPVAGRGVVSVLHRDGRRTTYEPVDADVAVGDAVQAGTVLGRIAAGGGHCGGIPVCLHWGLLLGDKYQDPLALLSRGRPVLLPPELWRTWPAARHGG